MSQLDAVATHQSLNPATVILTEMCSSSLSGPSTENIQPTNERAEHEAAVDSPPTDLAGSEAGL